MNDQTENASWPLLEVLQDGLHIGGARRAKGAQGRWICEQDAVYFVRAGRVERVKTDSPEAKPAPKVIWD